MSMFRFLLILTIALTEGLLAQEGPRLYVAPPVTEGLLSGPELLSLAQQFRHALRAESRYRVVERSQKKAASGLFGAMGDIASADESEGGTPDSALRLGKILEADGVLVTRITLSGGAKYKVEVKLFDTRTGRQQTQYSLVCPKDIAGLLGGLTQFARLLERRLAPLPKPRAPWPEPVAIKSPEKILVVSGASIGGAGLLAAAGSFVLESLAQNSPTGSYSNYLSYKPANSSSTELAKVKDLYAVYSQDLRLAQGLRLGGFIALGCGAALVVTGLLLKKKAPNAALFPEIGPDYLGFRFIARL